MTAPEKSMSTDMPIPEDIRATVADMMATSDFVSGDLDHQEAVISLAILAERRSNDWQSISDDAKSGKTILAIEDFERSSCDDDGNEKIYSGDAQVVFWNKKYAGWVAFGLFLESFEPTHWMPLPAPPSAILTPSKTRDA